MHLRDRALVAPKMLDTTLTDRTLPLPNLLNSRFRDRSLSVLESFWDRTLPPQDLLGSHFRNRAIPLSESCLRGRTIPPPNVLESHFGTIPPPEMDNLLYRKRKRSEGYLPLTNLSSKLTSIDTLPRRIFERVVPSSLSPRKSSPSADRNAPKEPYLELLAQPAAFSQSCSCDGLLASSLVQIEPWSHLPPRMRPSIQDTSTLEERERISREKANELEREERDRIAREGEKANELEREDCDRIAWSKARLLKRKRSYRVVDRLQTIRWANLLKRETESTASGFQQELVEKSLEELGETRVKKCREEFAENSEKKPLEETTDKSLEKPTNDIVECSSQCMDEDKERKIRAMKRNLMHCRGEDPGTPSEKPLGKAPNDIEETSPETSDNGKAFFSRSNAGEALEKALEELVDKPVESSGDLEKRLETFSASPVEIFGEKSPGNSVGETPDMCLHTLKLRPAERHPMHPAEEDQGKASKDTEETPWETLDSGKAFSFRSNAGKALEKSSEEIVEIPKGNCGAKSPTKHAGEFLEICLHTPEIRPAERRPMHPAEEDLGKASKDMEETPPETPENGKAFSLWPVRRQEFLLRKQIQSELSMEREKYAKLLKKESQVTSKLEESERDLKSEKEINRQLRTDREDLKSKLNEVADDLNTERKVNGGFKKVKENFESRIKAMEGDLKVEVDLMTIMIKKERGSFELKLQKVEGSLNELSETNSSLVKEKEDFKSRLGELEDSLEKEQDKIVCQICFVQPRNAVCLPCMHFLSCHDCLQRHVKKKKSCPTCRASISGVLQCLLSA